MQFSLPPISPFLELIELQKRRPDKIILRDHYSGVTATAGQLLFSVSQFREKLRTTLLQSGIYDGVEESDDKFIFLLAPPGWEYVVSMLTIFSLGAGLSAQCKKLSPDGYFNVLIMYVAMVIKPEEMIRFFKLSNPLALLYASAFTDKVQVIKASCDENCSGVNQKLSFVEIQTSYSDPLASHIYVVESSYVPNPAQTGSLFFTSGTSGNQKGVVHSYQALLASARERISTWKLTEDDVVLNQKPGNWMGGIFGIVPTLMSGACL